MERLEQMSWKDGYGKIELTFSANIYLVIVSNREIFEKARGENVNYAQIW